MSATSRGNSRPRIALHTLRWGGLALLALALLAPRAALATEVPFGTQSVISTGASVPYSVYAADVDGDGDTDVLSASYLDDKIAWYENEGGSPPVWTAHTISAAAVGAVSVFAADVDGDGDTDVLSASELDNKIAWYENEGGSPPAWTPRTISTASDGVVWVFAADVDGDGDTDVLSASEFDNKVVWYENDGGSPPAWTPRTIAAAAAGDGTVFAADVDGDGDTDVISGSLNSDTVAWHENDGGSPPVWTARTISTTADGAGSVFAADVDDDGDTDVLSASYLGDKIEWHENHGGSPPVWTTRLISTAADGPVSVFAADVDGDGDTDVLTASLFDDKVAWYENDGGSPPAWTARIISTAGDAPVSVFAGDMDGDGDTDVLSASFDDDKVAWYENRTIHRSSAFQEQRIISTDADYARAVVAADVDGDGDTDALSASENDDKIAWYENLDGYGNFGPQQVITAAADHAISVFAADVDGDGDVDALSASVDDDTIAWYENDGTPGGLGDWIEHDISTTADGAVKVFAADVDGDGDVDVLSASNFDGKVAWYRNLNGSGSFGPAQVIDTAGGVWDVSAADIDGDGDTDVLSAFAGNDTIAWYANLDGAGTFGPRQVLTNTADYVLSVFAADVDGDGDLDVLSASNFDRTVAWYENDGTPGGLGDWTKHVIGTAAQGAYTVTGADMDGDGDVDALATLYPDHEVVWYENLDGSGAFGPKQLVVASLYLFWAAAADVDGDGDLDALTASAYDIIAWYPNKGGQFALPTTDVTPPVLAPDSTNAVLKIVVTHRGRPGDTDLELATLQLRFEQGPGGTGVRPRRLTSAEANALVADLYIYRDDGDGIFDPGDSAVATVGTLNFDPTTGQQIVAFADGDANARVAQGAPRTYFVVLHIAADAPSQVPNDFRVVHVTDSSPSTAEDASADIPLSLEWAVPVSSGVVGFPPRVVSVVPPDNALNVPVGTNVTVVFSEPVDPDTVTPSTIRLINPDGVAVPAIVGLAPDGRTATLDPDPVGGGLVFRAVYTVEVTGVKDLAGIPVVPFTSRCATVPSPAGGTPLPSVSDQSVLPGLPGLLASGLSTAALGGSTVGPNLGFSVTAAGDLNNDTLGDFVGGAPGYAPGGMTEAGAAAIYLGSNAPEPSSGNHPREVADVIFTGQAPHDRAGTSVAAGFDFDGDGIGDILIGAEQVNRTVDPPEVTGAGKVYLIFFKPQEYDFDSNGIPDYLERSELFVPLAQVGAGISGVVFTGAASGDQAGYAVAAGGRLENSDSRDEIVIGAPGAANDNGRVYVVFSNSGVSGVKSLAGVGTGIPGVTYVGSAGERLGSSMALPGDVTDPAGPDIAIGAPLADTTQTDAGRVYVAAAGSLIAGTVNATSIATQVHGDQACEELGFAVAGGGDNRAGGTPIVAGGDLDLLVGAPYYDAVATPGDPCLDTTPTPNSGRVLQTTGRLPGAVIGASQVGSTVEGVIWRGVQAGGGLGWSVARLGDLSGNNLDDIGLGAPFSSPGMNGAGAVYVIEGSANTGLLGAIDADQVGQIVSGGIFLGTQLEEAAGLALCAAGDLDGDGLSGSTTADDFTVGSPGWDASLGTVHQVLGTLLQQPGECTALGCTVADLLTGAVLVVPPNALAQGTKFRFQVQGLPSLPSSCGSHLLAGKSLVGSSDNSRTDCGAPPCSPPGFAVRPGVEVPTQQGMEYQLAMGESLTLRYCDATFGWTAVPGGPASGLVRDNSFVPGRKAVAASGVDSLRRYGVFFDDQDHDDARDTCDCSPTDATRWSVPGPPGDLLFAFQGSPTATLTWGPPACMGGTPGALLYDTIRSTSPSNFVTGAVCVEANGTDLTSLDTANPPPGQVFYYIVSPENGCLSGPACSDPACVQPAARDC